MDNIICIKSDNGKTYCWNKEKKSVMSVEWHDESNVPIDIVKKLFEMVTEKDASTITATSNSNN